MLRINQLIGFGGRQAATPSVATLSYIDSTGSSFSSTITAPAAINAGDLLILVDSGRNTVATPAEVIPSGFTKFDEYVDAGLFYRVTWSYKIADGTEDGATLTGMLAIATISKICYQFRGNVSITGISQFSKVVQFTSSDPTAQVVTASGGAVPLIVLVYYNSTGNISPRTFSPAKDGEENDNNDTGVVSNAWLAYKIYNSSPADVTVDMDDEGDRNLIYSFYLQVT
ncbi:MAG: hypothetical protein WC322_01425 [Candidatus Paceibacterota bacterium]|jgi:hypothetical protein